MKYIIVIIFSALVGYGYGTTHGVHDAGRGLKCTNLRTDRIAQCKALYLDTWYRS